MTKKSYLLGWLILNVHFQLSTLNIPAFGKQKQTKNIEDMNNKYKSLLKNNIDLAHFII